MSQRGADHTVIGLTQGGQRQRIGRGAVEGKKDITVFFKQRSEGVGGAGGPDILAIGRHVALIGVLHGGKSFRADSGIVIAGKLLGNLCHV